MVYKLDDADKLCGVTYVDWEKRYSPIPKATCETLEGQCDGIQIDFDCGKKEEANANATNEELAPPILLPEDQPGNNIFSNQL